MKTIQEWANNHHSFAQIDNQKDTQTLVKMVREEAINEALKFIKMEDLDQTDIANHIRELLDAP